MSKKKVDTISASQVGKFLFCPLYYKYIYVDGASSGPGNEYTSFGKAIHSALELNYKQKITTRKDLGIAEVTNEYKQKFLEELEKSSVWNPGSLENLAEQGEELIYQYMKKIAPTVQPTMVEHEFKIPLKSGAIIHGFIDLVTEDCEVIDHKTASGTTKNTWTQKAVQDNTQFKMYALAFRKMFNKAEKCVGADVLVRGDKAEFKRLRAVVPDIDVLSLVQLIEAIERCVHEDFWYPNLNNCSACELNKTCPKLAKMPKRN